MTIVFLKPGFNFESVFISSVKKAGKSKNPLFKFELFLLPHENKKPESKKINMFFFI